MDYVTFCEQIAGIFTSKDLEKCPTKRLDSFVAPSILTAKHQLENDDESALHALLQRLGTEVRHRRLLIKPFF